MQRRGWGKCAASLNGWDAKPPNMTASTDVESDNVSKDDVSKKGRPMASLFKDDVQRPCRFFLFVMAHRLEYAPQSPNDSADESVVVVDLAVERPPRIQNNNPPTTGNALPGSCCCSGQSSIYGEAFYCCPVGEERRVLMLSGPEDCCCYSSSAGEIFVLVVDSAAASRGY